MNSWIRKMGKAAAMGLGMILILACAFAEEPTEAPEAVVILKVINLMLLIFL